MNLESSKSLTPFLLNSTSHNNGEAISGANPRASAQVLLKALIRGVGEARNLADAFDTVLRTVCQQGWQCGEVWQHHAETNGLTRYRVYHHKPTKSFATNANFSERIWVSQQSEWYSDITELPKPLFPDQAAANVCLIRAALGIPLLADGQTLAVLTFFSDAAMLKKPAVG